MSDLTYGAVAPAFACKDFEAMIKFYEIAMGFGVVYKSAVYCVLTHGGVSIHLYPERDGFKGGQSSAYLYVSDVDAAYESLKNIPDVKVIHHIDDQQYGLRDFLIEDSEGNRIGISQPMNG